MRIYGVSLLLSGPVVAGLGEREIGGAAALAGFLIFLSGRYFID